MPDSKYNAVCEFMEFSLKIEKSLFDSYLEELEQCDDEFERLGVEVKYSYQIMKRVKERLKEMKDLKPRYPHES